MIQLVDTCSGLNMAEQKEYDNRKRGLFQVQDYHNDNDNSSISDELDINNLAKLRGFSIETHKVVTDDQYILAIHRLINPMTQTLDSKGVIVMQHGIICSSSIYLVNSSPKFDHPRRTSLNHGDFTGVNNLAYTLSNLGYDVWLTNFRGNQYSNKHLLFKYSDRRFWNFTIDELVKYDYKASVNYILDYTKTPKYTFIGHSLGSTVGLGSLLIHQNTAITNNLTCSILMAPVVSIKFVTGDLIPVFRVATILFDELSPFPGPVSILGNFLDQICVYFERFCFWVSETLAGKSSATGNSNGKKKKFLGLLSERSMSSDDDDYGNDSRAHKFLFKYTLKQSISVRALKHITQIRSSGRVSQYNYGPKRNLQVYGSELPPPYDLKDINEPNLKIALVSAAGDAVSTKEEIDWIVDKINTRVANVERINSIEKLNHLDLIMSNEAGRFINKPIVEFIERNNC